MDNFRRKFILSALSALLGAKSLAATPSSRNNISTRKSSPNSANKQKSQIEPNATSSTINNTVFDGARLGINLAGIADWSTEFPLVDLFKQSRAWFVEGKEPANSDLEIDAGGWISRLPLGIVASTIISSLDNGHFPSGTYIILYDGEGEIQIPHHSVQSAKAGRIVVNVNESKGLFRLDIVKINPQNYIKNIRVIPKQFESSYQKNPWNPDFLSRWQGVACIRLMDFMATNNSTQVNWADRPRPNDASYAQKGVPLELMIDLANRLNTEPWFCLPHQASDDYIKQFASIVKASLNTSLRAWVEYSNEVWNGGFSQNTYAAKEGLRLKFATQPWEAAWKYNAHRSVQIFNIWQQVFGLDKNDQHKRFVRVLASQAANSAVSEQILSFEQAAKQTDVLAIAPYINFSVSPNADDGMTDKTVANWSLNKLFDHLNKVVAPIAAQWIQSNKKVANQYGLKLVAYEAGQHLVGVAGAENNEPLAKLFLNANADARMGELYTRYLSAWANNGGDLMCAFNSVGVWSKWGSWGLLQYYNDKPTLKFKAVIDWANAHGQKMRF